jgi:hypothetical protein
VNVDDLRAISWDRETDVCSWRELDKSFSAPLVELEATHSRLRQMLAYLMTGHKANAMSQDSQALSRAAMVKHYIRNVPPDPNERVWFTGNVKPWSTWIDMQNSKSDLCFNLTFIDGDRSKSHLIGKIRLEATHPGFMKAVGIGLEIGLSSKDMVNWVKESMAASGLAIAVPLPEGLTP